MKSDEISISIIAAIGSNRELGKDNALLWHIPEDMRRFRDLTSGHVVIMGRKTFQSIGKPLPNRINIVITSDGHFSQKGIIVVHSINEALEQAKKHGKSEVFIIGGGQIYNQALPIVHKLYLTIVESSYPADTFFPDYKIFTKVDVVGEGEYKGLRYRFLELEKD